MKHKYLNFNSLFECQIKSSDSPVWKSILKSRVLLRKGIRWNVGKGDRIMCWWDNWCDNANLVDLLGLDIASIQNPELRVSDIITNDKCWDIDKIRLIVTCRRVSLLRGLIFCVALQTLL